MATATGVLLTLVACILVSLYLYRNASVARDETLPTTIIVPIGDHQVPNFTSYALATAQPQATVITCTPSWDYDPHYCMHRETEGHALMADWLAD